MSGRHLVFIALVVAVAGCTPLYYGQFSNATDQPMRVTLLSSPGESGTSRFVVAPGRTRRLQMFTDVDILVEDASTGRTLHRRRYCGFEDYPRYMDDRRTAHFLLTNDGVHGIPRPFWNTWRNHVANIVAEPTPWLDCDSPDREGT
jgi:hypothetical protein